MSHQSTPQIHSNRTPGSSFDTPNLGSGQVQHALSNQGQALNHGLNKGHNQGHNQDSIQGISQSINQGIHQGLNHGTNLSHHQNLNQGHQQHYSNVNSTTVKNHTQRQEGTLNSEHVVCDMGVRSAKQLLHAYIYEFLVKSTLPETAKRFIAEADVPSMAANSVNSAKTSPIILKQENDGGFKEAGSSVSASTTPQTPVLTASQFAEDHNLPGLQLSMDAPQGFLYEWWQVFWDVFQAKNGRGHPSAMADQYLQMYSMKNNQPSESLSGTGAVSMQMMQSIGAGQGSVQINGLGLGGSAPVAAHLHMQNMMQQQSGPVPPFTIQQQQIQRQLQGQNPPANMDSRQQRYMMQMIMKQQQKQQQSYGINHLSQQNPGPPSQQPGNTPHAGHPAQQSQQPSHPPHPSHQQQQQTPHQTPQQVPLSTPPVNQPSRHHTGLEQYPNNSIPINMKQQQIYMQQQQQGLTQAQNRIQQQAQTQMNNLRQQAVGPQRHQAPLGSGHGPNITTISSAAAAAAAAVENTHLKGEKNSPVDATTGINIKRVVSQGRAVHMSPQNMGSVPVPFSGGIPNGVNGISPSYVTGNVPMNAMQMHMNANIAVHGVSAGGNSNALQDYQNQLMVLERQNKIRLDIARSNGTESPSVIPQLVPHPQAQVQTSPSPRQVSQASPPNAPITSKLRKESAAKATIKRNSKQIVSSSAGTDTNGVAHNGAGSAKRERNGSSTLSADVDGAISKKKRKGNGCDSTKKPIKANTAARKEKATPKIKHPSVPNLKPTSAEDMDAQLEGSGGGKMPPPAGAIYQPSVANMEMLGSGGGHNGDPNYLTTEVPSSIDDIDFDFNSFLDGGDENLNDGLSGFHWPHPIEND